MERQETKKMNQAGFANFQTLSHYNNANNLYEPSAMACDVKPPAMPVLHQGMTIRNLLEKIDLNNHYSQPEEPTQKHLGPNQYQGNIGYDFGGPKGQMGHNFVS